MADVDAGEAGEAEFDGLPPKSMKGQLAAAAGWTTALQLAAKLIEVGFSAVLARILFPADFGVIAGATIFIQFASLLVEIGVGATLVQLPVLTRNDVRVAGTLVMMNGMLYFCLAQLLAPVAGSFLKIDGVTEVIRVLAFMYLIQPFGTVSENLLVRRLEVRRVMTVQLCVRIIGTGGIGVLLAWAGWGYWALVAAILSESVIKAIWMVSVVRPPMRPLLARENASRLMRRGAGFSIARVINFFALRADNALIGRTMDAAALGIYSRAYNLMSVPADLYTRIAERLIFPAMAKVQKEPARLRAAFLRSLELTALVGLPLSAILALLAPELIAFILGPRWTEVITPFAVLSSVTYLRLGAKTSGSLQRALAATGPMIFNQVVYAVLVILGCLTAYPYGIVAVAIAVALSVLVFYIVVNFNACRIAGVSLRSFLRCHAHGAIIAGLCTGVTAPVVLTLRTLAPPPVVTLFATAALLLCVGVGLAWWRPRWLLGNLAIELIDDAMRFSSRLIGARARA